MILAGLVVTGLIAAIIYSHEQEKRKEATRQANIERERRTEATRQAKSKKRHSKTAKSSKHRIPESEIDLIDLRLERDQSRTFM